MSFRAVELPASAHMRDTHVSVSIGERLGLTIGFGATLTDTLKIGNVAAFGLQIGEGENAGLIRLVPDPKGRAARKLKKGGLIVQFGFVAAFQRFGIQDKAYCRVEHVDGALQIALPRWREGGSGEATDSDLHHFTFGLSEDDAEALRDMATDADQEVPDYLADLVTVSIADYRNEKAEA
jgi:hypothetical protein